MTGCLLKTFQTYSSISETILQSVYKRGNVVIFHEKSNTEIYDQGSQRSSVKQIEWVVKDPSDSLVFKVTVHEIKANSVET